MDLVDDSGQLMLPFSDEDLEQLDRDCDMILERRGQEATLELARKVLARYREQYADDPAYQAIAAFWAARWGVR